MAELPSIEQRDPGAPIARGQIDPDLVKLARSRPKVGVITAAGLVVLCVVLFCRLTADRQFSGADATPQPAAMSDVLAGKVPADRLISLTAEPIVSQAIRAAKAEGNTGLRVAPARHTGERLWLVLPGNGWDPPTLGAYVGRLRRLDDLAFAPAVRAYASAHPRPAFATAAAVHASLAAGLDAGLAAGAASGTVTAVDGDPVALAAGDLVALDVVDPAASTVAASFTDRLPDTARWTAALVAAGVAPTATAAPDARLGQVRFTVAAPVTTVTAKLETAGLFGARVEAVTRHYQTTWDKLHGSPAGALVVGGTQLPDAQIELVGLFASRAIPADAYALVVGEVPDDYWYVMPITIALVVIALVFSWALIRAVRRDLIPPRAA